MATPAISSLCSTFHFPFHTDSCQWGQGESWDIEPPLNASGSGLKCRLNVEKISKRATSESRHDVSVWMTSRHNGCRQLALRDIIFYSRCSDSYHGEFRSSEVQKHRPISYGWAAFQRIEELHTWTSHLWYNVQITEITTHLFSKLFDIVSFLQEIDQEKETVINTKVIGCS